MNVTIGIDPGVKGVICMLDKRRVEVFAIPYVEKELDVDALEDMLFNFQGTWAFEDWHAWIEDARPMPRPKKTATCSRCGLETKVPAAEGVVSVATFVGNARLLEGVLRGMEIEVTRVYSRTWQRIALPGVRGREALKAASIKVAETRFPGLSLLPTKRCRKKSDHLSDAAHIAWFGSRCSERAA